MRNAHRHVAVLIALVSATAVVLHATPDRAAPSTKPAVLSIPRPNLTFALNIPAWPLTGSAVPSCRTGGSDCDHIYCAVLSGDTDQAGFFLDACHPSGEQVDGVAEAVARKRDFRPVLDVLGVFPRFADAVIAQLDAAGDSAAADRLIDAEAQAGVHADPLTECGRQVRAALRAKPAWREAVESIQRIEWRWRDNACGSVAEAQLCAVLAAANDSTDFVKLRFTVFKYCHDALRDKQKDILLALRAGWPDAGGFAEWEQVARFASVGLPATANVAVPAFVAASQLIDCSQPKLSFDLMEILGNDLLEGSGLDASAKRQVTDALQTVHAVASRCPSAKP